MCSNGARLSLHSIVCTHFMLAKQPLPIKPNISVIANIVHQNIEQPFLIKAFAQELDLEFLVPDTATL